MECCLCRVYSGSDHRHAVDGVIRQNAVRTGLRHGAELLLLRQLYPAAGHRGRGLRTGLSGRAGHRTDLRHHLHDPFIDGRKTVHRKGYAGMPQKGDPGRHRPVHYLYRVPKCRHHSGKPVHVDAVRGHSWCDQRRGRYYDGTSGIAGAARLPDHCHLR